MNVTLYFVSAFRALNTFKAPTIPLGPAKVRGAKPREVLSALAEIALAQGNILGLRVPREMTAHTFRQKALAAALTAAGESGASAFGLHA